ncbi:MAG: YceI family protein [Bacteroidia bacterium]
MKTYSISLTFAMSSIVLSIIFLQCSPSATTNPQKDTETTISEPVSKPIDQPTSIDQPESSDQPQTVDPPRPVAEPKSAEQPKPVAQSQPVEKPKPVTPSKPADQPKTAAEPTPAEQPKSVTEPKPVEPPKPVEQPKPIDKPVVIAEPVSAMPVGFTLKLLSATVKGTSTLHEWESQITEIEGKGVFQKNEKSVTTIQNAEIKIPVKGLKSKEGKKMDDKTYETFQSDANPFITYSFSNAVVKISDSHIVTVEASGNLSMAGMSKPVSLSAKGKELENGDLRLSVSKKIKMTDYNMEPPVMFLGSIKVGDEVTVSFDFELKKVQK